VLIVLALLAFGCQQQQRTITGVDNMDKKTMEKEVKDQFNQLVSALNQMNAGAWSENYSQDQFVSAIAGTDYYGTRSAWVDEITKYFSMRQRQRVDPVAVRVTALAPDLALMTSEEKSLMRLQDGKEVKSKHVFTMVWKKEPAGWKILHSHESWTDEPTN
jgi:ketosteroid isomerase-like protein